MNHHCTSKHNIFRNFIEIGVFAAWKSSSKIDLVNRPTPHSFQVYTFLLTIFLFVLMRNVFCTLAKKMFSDSQNYLKATPFFFTLWPSLFKASSDEFVFHIGNPCCR